MKENYKVLCGFKPENSLIWIKGRSFVMAILISFKIVLD